MQILLLALVLVLGLAVGTASANCFIKVDGLEVWLADNKVRKGSIGAFQLHTYLQGITDTLITDGAICIEDGVDSGDVIAVVRRHLPDLTKEYDILPSKTCAAWLVRLILTRRFPCEPKPDAKPPAK